MRFNFWLKYESIIYNTASSSEICPLTSKATGIFELFWTVLACKQCLVDADFSPDSDETIFFNWRKQFNNILAGH